MSVYLLFDTSHVDYQTTISGLVTVSHESFSPRLNLDQDKALIQIKDEVELNRIDFGNELGTLMLDSGDVEWAKVEVAKIGWSTDE